MKAAANGRMVVSFKAAQTMSAGLRRMVSKASRQLTQLSRAF
jgi:hypothetical protein